MYLQFETKLRGKILDESLPLLWQRCDLWLSGIRHCVRENVILPSSTSFNF